MLPIEIKNYLLSQNLPVTNQQLSLFDNCSSLKIKRNKFPNSVLEFSSDTCHKLLANNTLGISEILFVLSLEFSDNLISPTAQKLNPELAERLEDYPELHKRYEAAVVSGTKYTKLDLNLVNAVIGNRCVDLIPINENLDWTKIYIKFFQGPGPLFDFITPNI